METSGDDNQSAPVEPPAVRSAPIANTHISDTILAPKPFKGTSTENAHFWLEYFERYINYRQLSENDARALFCMLMHESASDFLSSLPDADQLSLVGLKQAFKQNYFRNPELRWRDAGDLWTKSQRPQESVAEYVVRIRQAAKRLELSDQTLQYAFLNGLKPCLRAAVVQHGAKTMQDSIQIAKNAEAAIEPDSSDMQTLLMKALQAQTDAAARQSAEMKQLSASVAALSSETAPPRQQGGAYDRTGDHSRPQQQQQPPRRPWIRNLKPTPQNRQRLNYAAQAQDSTGGQVSVRQHISAQPDVCRMCGREPHSREDCPARGQTCLVCRKLNHFAAVCRSGRPNRA